MNVVGRWRRSLICLILAGGAATSPSYGSQRCLQDSVAVDAEKRQIVAVINAMQEAWNRGDFRGYMNGFKNPDVVFVSGGKFQEGWQGTLDHYIRDYGASRGTLRFYDVQVEILSPDAAQLISRFELIRPQHPQYGINTRLMRKVNGRWVIALNHVSASETPPMTSDASISR
jgi:uncharacterized protein (TIGR02246 family)